MSGLYNMLMGRNPCLGQLFTILKINRTDWPMGRVRDAYVSEDGSKIFIFTRNGPSGMGLTEEEREVINTRIAKHPYFVRWWLDDFDETYCTYEFNTPAEHQQAADEIAKMTDTIPPMERFRKLLKDMDEGKKNEQVERAMEVGKQMAGSLEKMFAGDGQADTKEIVVENEDGSVVMKGFKLKDK